MANVTKNFWEVLLANYCYWPFVNFLNFKFVPLHFRMAVINLCAVFWNTFLSLQNQRSKKRYSEMAVDKAVSAAYKYGE